MPTLPDLTDPAWTSEELTDLRDNAVTELERREAMSSAPEQSNKIALNYKLAEGATPGEAWKKPTGAHDAYPLGWEVEFGGKQWRSLIAANVWSPTEYAAGWVNLTTVPPTDDGWAPQRAYKVSDVVGFGPNRYLCIQAHTSQPGWEPSAVPALWKKSLSAPVGEPPADGSWSGNNVNYAAATVVKFEGKEYRCRTSHWSQPDWSPAAAASLWELVTAPVPPVVPPIDPPTGTPAWSAAGVAYKTGDKVTYSGQTYTCTQPHTSQAAWAPYAAASLWSFNSAPVVPPPTPPATPAWSGSAVAYKVNDLVTYQGFTYKCLQAHTSQAGWTPSGVASLWQKQ